jgi:hypothetical protein
MFHVEHHYLAVEIEVRRADCSMWNISTMLGSDPIGLVPRGTKARDVTAYSSLKSFHVKHCAF